MYFCLLLFLIRVQKIFHQSIQILFLNLLPSIHPFLLFIHHSIINLFQIKVSMEFLSSNHHLLFLHIIQLSLLSLLSLLSHHNLQSFLPLLIKFLLHSNNHFFFFHIVDLLLIRMRKNNIARLFLVLSWIVFVEAVRNQSGIIIYQQQRM